MERIYQYILFCCMLLSLGLAPQMQAQTIDISGLSPTSTPAGTSLTFHTAEPPSAANQIDPTMAQAGTTYFAYFFDAANTCYSAEGLAIHVVCAGTSPAANNTPAGTSLTYHTGLPVSTANQVTPTSGFYYAAFFDPVNACFSDEVSGVFFDPACNAIAAGDDTFTGLQAGGTTPTVFTNDNVNGVTATDSLVTTPVVIANGGLTGVSFNADGTINIPAGAANGTYLLTYEICLESDPTTCDQAVVTIDICNLVVPTLIKN